LTTGAITEELYKNGAPTGYQKTIYKNGDELTLNGNSATYKIKK
jgi:hypothetical protein